MIMDIIVLTVLGASIFFSMRKGFALTVADFIEGVVSFAAAFFFADDLANYISAKTSFGAGISSKLSEILSGKWENSSVYKALPELFKKDDSLFGDKILTVGSERISSLFLYIISFLLILLAIRLVLLLFTRLFSRKSKGGFIGFADRLFGLIIGIVTGVINVFLFLAFIIPLTGFFFPDACNTVSGWFDSSFFAKDLYDNNLLLIIYRDFMMK